MTYRHPSVFAAEAITIDHASGGRLELAYGAAWFDKEHKELGIPFPALKDRIDAFEEAVQIVRGLLTTDGFTFEGAHFSRARATLLPRPVQQPHPPIWIGASGEKRMMPIAARYADVWHCFGPPRSSAAKSERLERASPRRPAATRPRSGGRRRCRSKTTSTPSPATSTRGSRPVSATSCAAGLPAGAPTSSPSRTASSADRSAAGAGRSAGAAGPKSWVQ